MRLGSKDFLNTTERQYVQVALPVPLSLRFTYISQACPGDVVHIPFGRKMLWGVVWAYDLSCEQPADLTFKSTQSVHLTLHFSQSFRQFLEKMSSYTMTPLGCTLKLALPAAIDYEKVCLYVWKDQPLPHDIKTPKILPPLGTQGSLTFWKKYWQVGLKTVKEYVRSGLLMSTAPLFPKISVQKKEPITLNIAQQGAVTTILRAWQDSLRPFLLEGVPGSGKTEVALTVMEHIGRTEKQVLILLPEIVLCHQWEKRYEKYFQMPLGVWHSGLSVSMRQKMFECIMHGECPVIIGARSALFLPYPRLGLIIVDEEHETSYKQDDGALYHGRDMAVLRAACEKIPILLLSATPSLESRLNVDTQRYHYARLDTRYGSASAPSFHIVKATQKPWIGPALRQALSDRLLAKEQSLLFLNRRGYACLFICFRCSYRAACKQCSVWLHIHGKKLLCHYCGFHCPLPSLCPQCNNDQGLAMMGAGIEKIKEEIHSFLPQARVLLFSSDQLNSPRATQEALQSILQRDVDIIVGTQLVAKGHHFPYLTCIGILDSDLALNDINFRASEQLFQLLYQVMGRAGRAHLPGDVYVQTLLPQEPFFQHLSAFDVTSFARIELARRQREHLPPFTRFALITFSDKCPWRVQEIALKWQQAIPETADMTVLGPAPAPLSPLRGRHRWRFLLRASRLVSLQNFINQWVAQAPQPQRSTQMDVDMDPYHFL